MIQIHVSSPSGVHYVIRNQMRVFITLASLFVYNRMGTCARSVGGILHHHQRAPRTCVCVLASICCEPRAVLIGFAYLQCARGIGIEMLFANITHFSIDQQYLLRCDCICILFDTHTWQENTSVIAIRDVAGRSAPTATTTAKMGHQYLILIERIL